ncbi:MAG: CorA family divalent cation transporter [Solirubrobacterales bacterium]
MPKQCNPSAAAPPAGIQWFDVAPSATADGLLKLLEPHCPGLEEEMLADLLCRDETPENQSWHGGAVRLASSFAVYAPEARENGGLAPVYTCSADAVYEAVELLAGQGWLITRWHDACLYRGSNLIEDGLSPVSRDALRAAVTKRWLARGNGNSGDLGVMVMHELALTYASTHRRFLAALEEWELALYGSEEPKLDISPEEEAGLHDLWGARARLRDWLNPLNVPGLRGDLNKAWLPVTDHDAVIKVDERVDKALAALAKLGEMLRSSFHLIHIKKTEAKRERNERLQRDLGLVAAAFLVPTLVVGFYGANTWIPGEHRQWGFLGMVLVMFIATITVSLVLRRMLDANR